MLQLNDINEFGKQNVWEKEQKTKGKQVKKLNQMETIGSRKMELDDREEGVNVF